MNHPTAELPASTVNHSAASPSAPSPASGSGRHAASELIYLAPGGLNPQPQALQLPVGLAQYLLELQWSNETNIPSPGLQTGSAGQAPLGTLAYSNIDSLFAKDEIPPSLQHSANELVDIDQIEYLLGQTVLQSLELVKQLVTLQQQHSRTVAQNAATSPQVDMYFAWDMHEALLYASETRKMFISPVDAGSPPPCPTSFPPPSGGHLPKLSEAEVRKLAHDFSQKPSRLDSLVESMWATPMPPMATGSPIFA